MIITEQIDDWTYASLPLSTPESEFGRFGSAISIWRAKAQPGRLPRKRDFRAEDFRGWHGWVIVYDVLHDPFDLRFRLFGTDLVERLNIENTGKLFSDAYAHVENYRVTLRHFEYLTRNRTIGMSCGPMNWEGLDFQIGVFLDLPVIDDDGEIAYFFTFARLGDEHVADATPLASYVRAPVPDDLTDLRTRSA